MTIPAPIDERSPAASSVQDLVITNENVESRLEQINQIKAFLASAAEDWGDSRELEQFVLPNGDKVSCVFWRDLFHITGTDILRVLINRFALFGRPVHNMKKFEEGVFSDLRNLKPGVDACLEEPKSPFLDMLYKNSCIRTQKKQKVFYWYSVPHDRLFYDALEREYKREKAGPKGEKDGNGPTSTAIAEPALSYTLDHVKQEQDNLKLPANTGNTCKNHSEPSSPLESSLTHAVNKPNSTK